MLKFEDYRRISNLLQYSMQLTQFIHHILKLQLQFLPQLMIFLSVGFHLVNLINFFSFFTFNLFVLLFKVFESYFFFQYF